MNFTDRRYDECTIIPLSGRTIFTVPPKIQLSLPPRQRRSLFLLRSAAVSFLVIGLWSFPTVTKAAVTGTDIFQATNAERTRLRIAQLRHDPRLDASAKMKADDMFARQYFGHQSPTGQRGWNWMQAAGYAFTEAGENLAMDFSSGNDVVAAWMTSSTHRENILNAKFTDVGVATVSGVFHGKKITIIVEHFGRQTSSASIASTVSPVPAIEPTAEQSTPVAASPPVGPVTKLVPSLVNPGGVSFPALSFTYLAPPATAPNILGLSTSLEIPVVPVPMDDNVGWLILGTLGLSASVIGLASILWPSIYPQPLSRLALTEAGR